MHSALPRLTLVLMLTLASACASTTSRASAAGSDRNILTYEQLREHQFRNALEAIEALRTNWLLTRGTDSFNSPTQVQVYVDDVRVGGIGMLRWITTPEIDYIRYYDGIAAAARWGLGHGQGVIFVATRPR